MPGLHQKLELRRLLIPELRQSLNILALPLLDLRSLIEQELEVNPFLEEVSAVREPIKLTKDLPPVREKGAREDEVSPFDFIAQPVSLYEVLCRQLGMFTDSDEDFRIGQELIGNIDENGYLAVTVEEIAVSLKAAVSDVERVLALIHKFEPAGIGARSVAECLLIQLRARNELDPLMNRLIRDHLDDIAKKNHSRISKALGEPWEELEPLVKRITALDPKPGRNFASEGAQRIMPDIVIRAKNENYEISINNEDVPVLQLNEAYVLMLKDDSLDPQTRAFLKDKQQIARDFLRAISRRTYTLRRIIEAIVEVQREAIDNDLSFLKPMTFEAIARKLDIHSSTVCRAIMNKYVRLPYGLVALKDFFTSHVSGKDGSDVSSALIKRIISESIQAEDKKHPLSDQAISVILSRKHSITASRRTIAKYRDDLKILSSSYRRER